MSVIVVQMVRVVRVVRGRVNVEIKGLTTNQLTSRQVKDKTHIFVRLRIAPRITDPMAAAWWSDGCGGGWAGCHCGLWMATATP